MKKYIAKIYLYPIGELNLGEFDNMGLAEIACEEVGKVLRKYAKNDFRYAIIDKSHYWKDQVFYYECSDCGGESETKTNYCPHCGAKMCI